MLYPGFRAQILQLQLLASGEKGVENGAHPRPPPSGRPLPHLPHRPPLSTALQYMLSRPGITGSFCDLRVDRIGRFYECDLLRRLRPATPICGWICSNFTLTPQHRRRGAVLWACYTNRLELAQLLVETYGAAFDAANELASSFWVSCSGLGVFFFLSFFHVVRCCCGGPAARTGWSWTSCSSRRAVPRSMPATSRQVICQLSFWFGSSFFFFFFFFLLFPVPAGGWNVGNSCSSFFSRAPARLDFASWRRVL